MSGFRERYVDSLNIICKLNTKDSQYIVVVYNTIDNTHKTTVTMIQLRPDFAFTNDTRTSPSRASYAVSLKSSKKYDRDISRAHCIQNSNFGTQWNYPHVNNTKPHFVNICWGIGLMSSDNISPNLCRHITSLSHNDLKIPTGGIQQRNFHFHDGIM